MWADSQALVAESTDEVNELGELFEYAAQAGHTIERLRATESGRMRQLTSREYARVLMLANAAHDQSTIGPQQPQLRPTAGAPNFLQEPRRT